MEITVYIQKPGEEMQTAWQRAWLEEEDAQQYFSMWNDMCDDSMKQGNIIDYMVEARRL